MTYLVSDHGGWALKRKVFRQLKLRGHEVTDLGPARLERQDDYPLWAAKLARQVQHHPGSQGIAICRSGVGMAMVTNKFSGIRAAQALTPAMAKQARRDENSNILSLAADYHSWSEIQQIIRAWLTTIYRPTKRFQRRLREIKRLERHAR